MNLFDQIVDTNKLHPNYVTVMHQGMAPEREELQRWAEGFPDRDGKFIREFQSSFNSSFWEIYLYAFFREIGFQFNWSFSSPDFLISKGKTEIVVEATTANNSPGKPAEWDQFLNIEELKNIKFNEMNKESIIRLSNVSA